MCNAVVNDGKLPEDWSRSWMVNVHKGTGDALLMQGIKPVGACNEISERGIEESLLGAEIFGCR